MRGGGEALVPVLAQQVGVRRREELLRLHRAEQAAEGTGQQQRPGAGVDPLARDVHQRDLEVVAVAGPVGHDEVTGERVAVRRLQRHLGVPGLGQVGQHPVGAQPVAQVDQHRLPQRALHPEPRPGQAQREHHRRDDPEDEDGAAQAGLARGVLGRGPGHQDGDHAEDAHEPPQRQEEPGHDDHRGEGGVGDDQRPPPHGQGEQHGDHAQRDGDGDGGGDAPEQRPTPDGAGQLHGTTSACDHVDLSRHRRTIVIRSGFGCGFD